MYRLIPDKSVSLMFKLKSLTTRSFRLEMPALSNCWRSGS